jgi:hypothetical protein
VRGRVSEAALKEPGLNVNVQNLRKAAPFTKYSHSLINLRFIAFELLVLSHWKIREGIFFYLFAGKTPEESWRGIYRGVRRVPPTV